MYYKVAALGKLRTTVLRDNVSNFNKEPNYFIEGWLAHTIKSCLNCHLSFWQCRL